MSHMDSGPLLTPFLHSPTAPPRMLTADPGHSVLQ